jgi:hypothetical protein
MNPCISMPDGSLHALTKPEADLLVGYLVGRLPHVEERDQPATLRMIEHLRAITNPETAYEALA